MQATEQTSEILFFRIICRDKRYVICPIDSNESVPRTGAKVRGPRTRSGPPIHLPPQFPSGALLYTWKWYL